MINYEWDYETIDAESSDILEHHHATKLVDFGKNHKNDTLVLVRDSKNEIDGLQDRSWAYVVNGKLPEYFSDAYDVPLHKVPKRFHKELDKYINSII